MFHLLTLGTWAQLTNGLLNSIQETSCRGWIVPFGQKPEETIVKFVLIYFSLLVPIANGGFILGLKFRFFVSSSFVFLLVPIANGVCYPWLGTS